MYNMHANLDLNRRSSSQPAAENYSRSAEKSSARRSMNHAARLDYWPRAVQYVLSPPTIDRSTYVTQLVINDLIAVAYLRGGGCATAPPPLK
jgi:hypothetical protein